MSDTPGRPFTLADPGPLGLAGFALTTFALSVFNAGLVDPSAEPVIFGIVLFYGGLAQLIAGAFEFFRNNTFGALAFSSYGAFWLAFWYLNTHLSLFSSLDHIDTGVGVFLLAWTIFTAYMLVSVWHVNWALTLVFIPLLITFIGLTIGKFSGVPMVTIVAGWFGILTALLAWYASFAGVFNSVSKKAKLPIGPKS